MVFELVSLLQWLVDVVGVGQSGKDKLALPENQHCSLLGSHLQSTVDGKLVPSTKCPASAAIPCQSADKH